MKNYPSTQAYLKLLLANIADLTEAADDDLANPRLVADLAAFRAGERDDLPEGNTRAVLNRLAGEPVTREMVELGGRAGPEFRKPATEPRSWIDYLLSVAFDSLNAAYVALNNQCDAELQNGKLHSLPTFARPFWVFKSIARHIDDWSGPLRTNRRPRDANEIETGEFLVYSLGIYSQSWRWEFHNKQAEQIEKSRELETYRPGLVRMKFADGMPLDDDGFPLDASEENPIPVQLFRDEYAMLENLRAIHFCDGLEEFEMRQCLRNEFPQCLADLPEAITPYTIVDAKERAKAYLTLEKSVRVLLTELASKADDAVAKIAAALDRRQQVEAGEVQAADATSTDSWIRPIGETPPVEFCADGDLKRPCGPIVGNRTELGATTRYAAPNVGERQKRNVLEQAATDNPPAIWVRHDSGKKLAAYYRSFADRDKAKMIVESLRTEGNGNERKATEPK